MDDITYPGERGPRGSREAIEDYVRAVIEQNTTVNDDTTADRLARGIVSSILSRLGLRELANQEERRARDDERRRTVSSIVAAIEEDLDEIESLGLRGAGDYIAALHRAIAYAQEAVGR